jgi:hypothetical protein
MTYCKHVYEYVTITYGNCSSCGQPAHQIDWELLAKQRKEHRDKYGLLYIKAEWWSI